MKRSQIIATAGALVATGAAAAMTAPVVAAHGTGPSVKLVHTGDGKLLATSKGFTLYMFTHDKSGKDTCQSISMCTGTWPPYTVKSKPVAGPGIKASKLGTTRLSNGKEQVTYFGHPLYRYAFDGGPAMTGYIGALEFSGHWYAITAAGKAVK